MYGQRRCAWGARVSGEVPRSPGRPGLVELGGALGAPDLYDRVCALCAAKRFTRAERHCVTCSRDLMLMDLAAAQSTAGGELTFFS
jgi:hypothetical protein